MNTIRKEHMTPEFQILRMNSDKFFVASGDLMTPPPPDFVGSVGYNWVNR